MQGLNFSKKNLRRFGIIMAMSFLIIAGIIYFKHKELVSWPFFVSGVFGLAGISIPVLLKPVYAVWMKLAFLLGWVNTRLILFIIFYLLITPISIILRLCRNDLLARKIDRQEASYWKQKGDNGFTKEDYEKQF